METEIVVSREVVDMFTYAMTHEDIETMLNLWAPHGVWEIMATSEKFRGLDEIRQLVKRSVAARNHRAKEGLLPYNVFSNEEGTKFCWEYIHKGVVTNKWPESPRKPPVGTKFDLPITLICEVYIGKIVKIREYFDLLTLIESTTHHHLYA